MSADFHQPIPPAIADAAAVWLARRDRGLTAAEQDEYMQWLAADPRHTTALAQHAAALERMMRLYEWTPAHDTEPNPDLFRPSRSASALRWIRSHRAWTAGLAAAAALAVTAYVSAPRATAPESTAAVAPKSYLRVNERMALPDGSRVELKDSTRLVVQYSATERRVKLTGGEAHFSVWKDKDRPFIVDAAGVEVRAVGTAFNVRLGADKVEVLVTEGRVRVGRVDPNAPERLGDKSLHLVAVGERAVVPLGDAVTAAIQPVVTGVTVEDIARELAWQAPRLQFYETPLADAVAEFNRLNRHQLVLDDPALATLRIGGTFRPDNVEGFVRLLGETLEIEAAPAGDNRTVLRRGK
jgi:transmembrane sensor